MFFLDKSKKITCTGCGYIVTYTKDPPAACPKCNAVLHEARSGEKESPPFSVKKTTAKKTSQVQQDFAKNVLMQAKPDMVVSDADDITYQEKEILEIQVSKTSITDSEARVKVKLKKKAKMDLSQDQVSLGNENEFLRFMGVITKDRYEIYASNEKYKYFLELSSNLQYIATSILSGELDRMVLTPPEGGEEELCFFKTEKNFIFVVLGNFPDKKAAWLLNQMKINLYELLHNEDVDQMPKIDQYNLSRNFGKRAKGILEEYIKLQEVFSSKKLESLDKFLRVDYFGLSYMSIGVMSKFMTDTLEIQGLPPMDPNEENVAEAMEDLKESLMTAKIQAMAANTVANCAMMPHWISVKLGFQRYRFILFSKIREYYIALLAEGNLDHRLKIINNLHSILDETTKNPFFGDLSAFKEVLPPIVDYLKIELQSLQSD